jgi:hypothetical protein
MLWAFGEWLGWKKVKFKLGTGKILKENIKNP